MTSVFVKAMLKHLHAFLLGFILVSITDLWLRSRRAIACLVHSVDGVFVVISSIFLCFYLIVSKPDVPPHRA